MLKFENLIFLLFIKVLVSESVTFFDTINSIPKGFTCITADNQNGICTEYRNCVFDLKNSNLNNICSFEGKMPIVCCTNTTYSNNLNNKNDENMENSKSPLKQRIADERCEYYNPSFHDIGSSFVGGRASKAEEHPHMAAIGWSTTDQDGVTEIDWKCGGSIISNNFLITAAHCTKDKNIQPDIIRSGDLNLVEEDPYLLPDNFSVTQIHVHPNYEFGKDYDDIALIKFSPEFIHDSFKTPACLWTQAEIPVTLVTAMGYGTTAFAGIRSNELFQGDLTLVSHLECSRNYEKDMKIPNGIIESQMICAIDRMNKQDTCQGDSGGPLQFTTGEKLFPRHNIIGITSFGKFCAAGIPGVYTRISHYIDWIESIVWSELL